MRYNGLYVQLNNRRSLPRASCSCFIAFIHTFRGGLAGPLDFFQCLHAGTFHTNQSSSVGPSVSGRVFSGQSAHVRQGNISSHPCLLLLFERFLNFPECLVVFLAFSFQPFSRGIPSSPCLRASLSVCHLYRSCISMHLLACVRLFMYNFFVYLFVCFLFVILSPYLFIHSFSIYYSFVCAPLSFRFVFLACSICCSSVYLFARLFFYFLLVLLLDQFTARSFLCLLRYLFLSFAPTSFLSADPPFRR